MSRQCRLPPQMCFSLSGAGWTFSGTQVPRCLASYINFFFVFLDNIQSNGFHYVTHSCVLLHFAHIHSQARSLPLQIACPRLSYRGEDVMLVFPFSLTALSCLPASSSLSMLHV